MEVYAFPSRMEALADQTTEYMAKKSLALFVLLVLVIPILAAQPAPVSEPPEFVFARLIYGSGRDDRFGGGYGRRGGRGGSWATDFPEADYKFMYGIQRLSNI